MRPDKVPCVVRRADGGFSEVDPTAGVQVDTLPSGRVTQLPPAVTVAADGHRVEDYPDGTRVERRDDGGVLVTPPGAVWKTELRPDHTRVTT